MFSQSKLHLLVSVVALLLPALTAYPQCDINHHEKLQFQLVRRCQRSQQHVIYLENTQSLVECFEVAKSRRGLALNYAQRQLHQQENEFEAIPDANDLVSLTNYTAQNKRHFWDLKAQYFNCHILDCAENASFRGLQNDSRFDYYSLYNFEKSAPCTTCSCLAEIGFFNLHTTPRNYLSASKICGDSAGSLAHIISERRTNALSQLLRNHGARPALAYVGLHFNRSYVQPNDFFTAGNHSLNCYLYRAWAPGYPLQGESLGNTSCVALTKQSTWKTVDCGSKLPFLCELHTTSVGADYAVRNRCHVEVN